MATGNITHTDPYGMPGDVINITSAGHGLTTGDTVIIADVGGTVEANGTWVITVRTTDTFTLDGSAWANIYTSGGTWTDDVPSPGPVTGATNAAPIVITSTSHGLTTGDLVQVFGVIGNDAANGMWAVTVLNGDAFSLNGSTGSGAYISGGSWTEIVSPGIITGATNASPVVITSVGHGLVTGDVVSISGVGGNTTVNCNNAIVGIPITKLTADTFSLDGVAGNSNYTSGGVFRKILDIDPESVIPTMTTITQTEGTVDIALSDSAANTFPDGTSIVYLISNGTTVLESGVGTYKAASNSVTRDIVALNGGDGFGLVSLPTGAKTVFCVGGGGPSGQGITGQPIPGVSDPLPIHAHMGGMNADGSGSLPGWRIEELVTMEDVLLEVFLRATDPASNRNQQRAAARELMTLIVEERATWSRIRANRAGTPGGQLVGNSPADLQPTAVLPAEPPPVTGAPRPPQRPPQGANLRVGLDPAVITGVIEASINLLTPNPDAFANEGMLSMRPDPIIDDASRIGMSNVIYFVASRAWRNPNGPNTVFDWPQVTLRYGTVQRQGFFNCRFPPPYRNERPIYLRLDGTDPGKNVLPFRVDSAKLGPTDYVRAGLPADIFLYWPAYRQQTENTVNSTPPQMFFLSWQNPLSRCSNFGAGGQVGHRLTVADPRTYPVVTLLMSGQPWCSETTSLAKSDTAYLYIGTIVPPINGAAIVGTNLRLMTNQFNRIAYEDAIDDPAQFWIVNPALHNNGEGNAGFPLQIHERMNPTSYGGQSWRHCFVDPTDFDLPNVGGAAQTLASPVFTRSFVATNGRRFNFPGMEFSYKANPQGMVTTRLFRRGFPWLLTAASNASPIVITHPTQTYTTGQRVTISGVHGNTAANGTWIITRIGATSFSLDGSTGNGAYTAGGIIEGESVPCRAPLNNPNTDADFSLIESAFAELPTAGGVIPGLNIVEVKQAFMTAGISRDFAEERWGFYGADAIVRSQATGGGFIGAGAGVAGTLGGLIRTGRQCGLRARGSC